jgi:hypothetical protein
MDLISKLKKKRKFVDSGSREAAVKQSATRACCHDSGPTFKTKPSLRGTRK